MRRIITFLALAAGLFLTLVLLETVKRDEPFSLSAFAFDLLEIALLALAVAATAYVSLETREIRRERADLLNDLARARSEGERWRTTARTHIDGLGKAINSQFEQWRLGEGEAEIAMLMLKGFSHKEIAGLRQTSAATVRQQAAAIYRKSGLTSRAELAAFFLEDLFASEQERSAPRKNPLKLIDPIDRAP